GVFALFLLALAIEGVFCIAIALPLGLIIGVIGGTLGYFVQKFCARPSLPILSIVLVVPGASTYESQYPSSISTFAVTSSVTIDRPAEVVWHHLINFTEIPPPTEPLFRAGVSYPQRAEIIIDGGRKVRYCIFNSGAFVEPVIVWDPPYLLRFAVQSQ